MEQLIYVSRATFPTRSDRDGIEPEVARILMQSQRNNPQRGLVGALYFGEGCFFQCLEGETAAIDALLARLDDDSRHEGMRVLRRHAITAPNFSRWSMKYVPVAADVQRLLRAHGLKRFDPYRFNDAAIDAFVALLQKRPETAGPAAPAAQTSAPETRRLTRVALLAWSALGFSLLSLLLATLAFLEV